MELLGPRTRGPIKRAPGDVRYLGQCGGVHVLTRSFTARDPKETFGGALTDGNTGVLEKGRARGKNLRGSIRRTS